MHKAQASVSTGNGNIDLKTDQLSYSDVQLSPEKPPFKSGLAADLWARCRYFACFFKLWFQLPLICAVSYDALKKITCPKRVCTAHFSMYIIKRPADVGKE